MRRLALAWIGLVVLLFPGWLAQPPPTAAVSPVAAEPWPAAVRILGGDGGDDGDASARARRALERVLTTGVGLRARELIESDALPGPLTIELNRSGDQFTRYRVPGRELSETIRFDPDTMPVVETEAGPLRALPETVLAHELGHAVFKLVSEQAVIEAVENPVREALGLPRRRHF